MLDHLGIQCADMPTSAAFYDAVLAPLGASRMMDFGVAMGYGADKPEFWIGVFNSGEGFRESHIAFAAPGPRDGPPVLRCRGRSGCRGAPRTSLWPEYHPDYYGAFVRDPDGNNVEAVCHVPETAGSG